MSLITYIEPVNIGSLFSGVGAFLLIAVIAIILLRLFRPVIGLIDTSYNRETKYNLVEEKLLTDYAMEKGIDLDKELIERDIIKKEKKSIRKRIENELFDKLFPEAKKTKA